MNKYENEISLQDVVGAEKTAEDCSYRLVYSQHNTAYVMVDKSDYHPPVLEIGRKHLNTIIKAQGRLSKKRISATRLLDINEELEASAEMSGIVTNIWQRVAVIDEGIEIDIADVESTRIQVTAEGVKTLTKGSTVLFSRSPLAQGHVVPAEEGDLALLKKYINISHSDFLLFKGWLSYTLAHPKTRAGSVQKSVSFH